MAEKGMERMKKAILIIIVIVVALEGVNVILSNSRHAGKPRKDFGMISGGYQPKEFENGSLNSFSYWVKMDFPAAEAVGYYEGKLREKGWTPMESTASAPQRQWTTSIRQDPQSMVPDCGYIYQSNWTKEKSVWTTALTLTYYDTSPGKVCSPAPKNNELLVTLREWYTSPTP